LLLSTLAFGSWEYLGFRLKLFTVMLALAGWGFLAKISWNRSVVAVNLILPVTYLLIGTSEQNEVWGVLFLPFVFVGAAWGGARIYYDFSRSFRPPGR
jgi:hypothetical protein